MQTQHARSRIFQSPLCGSVCMCHREIHAKLDWAAVHLSAAIISALIGARRFKEDKTLVGNVLFILVCNTYGHCPPFLSSGATYTSGKQTKKKEPSCTKPLFCNQRNFSLIFTSPLIAFIPAPLLNFVCLRKDRHL